MLHVLVLMKSMEMYSVSGRIISVFCTLFSLLPYLLSQDLSRFLHTMCKALWKILGPYLYGQLQALLNLNAYSGVRKVTHEHFYRWFGVKCKYLEETYVFCPSKNLVEGINRLS